MMDKPIRSRLYRRLLIYMMTVAVVPLALLTLYMFVEMGNMGRESLRAAQSVSSPQELAEDLATVQRALVYRSAMGLVLLLVVIGGLAATLSQRIAQPILHLGAAVRALVARDLEGEIPVEGDDEVTDLAISLGEMKDTVRAQLGEISVLDRVGRILSSTLDLNTLLHDMANQLADMVHATGCVIILLEPDSGRPVPMAAFGEYYDDYRNVTLPSREPSAVQVAMSGKQPLVIRDVDKTPFVTPRLSGSSPDRSLLILPLVVKDRTIGAALIGDNRQTRDFAPREVDRATNMARQIAVAIDNAQLYETTQRHLHDLSLLYQTSAAISTTLDEETVFDMAIQAYSKVFDVTQCQLIIFDDTSWGRLVAEYWPRHSPRSRGLRLPVAGTRLLEWVGENRQPLVIQEAGAIPNPLLQGYAEIAGLAEAGSVLVAPLLAKGAVIGAIVLVAEEGRLFSAEEISLAQTLANQIASVVQNARLYRQMAEEKRKFELAALNMGEGLIILDREDGLLFANPQAQATLGLESSALGLPLATLCPQPELVSLLSRRSGSGEGIVVGEMQAGGGELRDLTLSMAPVRDEGGRLQWWVMVIHDITRLKELDRLKSEFISTVSHELRTPLASIMGFSEMLLTKQPGPLTGVQEEFLGIIYESSERLLALVNDLLDVSRIESGRLKLQPRLVHPVDLLRGIFAAMQPLAQQKSLELHVVAPDALPAVRADPRRLEQVLSNLIHNAIKFTSDRGQVTLKAWQEERALYFSVADTGMGIPPQDMEKLFTKFYRSAQAVQDAIGGTGLGLYIARNIIEAHGGEIGVESELDQGTTVWFWLPLGETSEVAEAETEELDQYA